MSRAPRSIAQLLISSVSVIPQIAGFKRKLDNDAIADRRGSDQHERERDVLHLHMSREAVEQHFRAGPTDGFCNFKGDTDTRHILFAYELKAPHKLPWRTLQSAGLANNDRAFDVRRDIWERPEDEAAGGIGDGGGDDTTGNRVSDPISQDEEDDADPLFATAGVITQLYDPMIRERIRYGYISTSDCYIFLRIDLESPAIVEYYTVRRPQADDRLPPPRMLPLVRITLLALLSLARGGSIPTDTATRAMKQGRRWPVVRRAMTETTDAASLTHNVGRESTGDESFRQSTGSNTSGSANDLLVTNRRAGHVITKSPDKRKRDDEDELLEAADGTMDRRRAHDRGSDSLNKRLKTSANLREAPAAASLPTPPPLSQSPPGPLMPLPPRCIVGLNDPNDPEVFRRAPYCTSSCIFGVVGGGSPDLGCPNYASHPFQHPPTSVFRELLRRQLAEGPSCHVLWVGWSGSTATIFKIRLASLGYVVVAKASSNRAALRTERRIYRKYLVPAQESGAVPPCLGLLDLPEPWIDPDVYSDHLGHDLTCCLLLGWIPGQHPQDALSSSVPSSGHNFSLSPSQKEQKQRARAALRASVRAAFESIHSLGLLHGDATLRNLLVESAHPEGPFRARLIDFEAAKPCEKWWERLQQKWRRQRRRPPRVPTDDKQALFQVACEQEIAQCLADVDLLY